MFTQFWPAEMPDGVSQAATHTHTHVIQTLMEALNTDHITIISLTGGENNNGRLINRNNTIKYINLEL